MKLNQEAFEQARRMANGMGWQRMTRLLVTLGLDRSFGIHGPRRIRKKKMRRLLERAIWQSIIAE